MTTDGGEVKMLQNVKEKKIWLFWVSEILLHETAISFDAQRINFILASYFAGGWLLVSNVVVDDPSSRELYIESSYREISNCHRNKKLFITENAMKELRTHLSFTQLRFQCNKQKGRMIHVTTATNSSGEAVVQYFSGQTSLRPLACGSFNRMKEDNSTLTGVCHQWKDQQWGHAVPSKGTLTYHPFYVNASYHWLLTPGGPRWECDDYTGKTFFGLSSGDFWKVFVR